MYCDAHIHPVDLAERDPEGWNLLPEPSWQGAVVSHDPQEYARTQELRSLLPPTYNGFGIHPQSPRTDTMEFLAALASRREIDYIGESGFDFFGDLPSRTRTNENLGQQRAVFEFQIALAERYSMPLLIHSRRAMDIILGYGRQLCRLPAVIFHSWPGRSQDAVALLRQGINAYFSFGTTLLRGARHAIESCADIEESRLLSETDAPWQPPKGEGWTQAVRIVEVVDEIARIRKNPSADVLHFLEENFHSAFGRKI